MFVILVSILINIVHMKEYEIPFFKTPVEILITKEDLKTGYLYFSFDLSKILYGAKVFFHTDIKGNCSDFEVLYNSIYSWQYDKLKCTIKDNYLLYSMKIDSFHGKEYEASLKLDKLINARLPIKISIYRDYSISTVSLVSFIILCIILFLVLFFSICSLWGYINNPIKDTNKIKNIFLKEDNNNELLISNEEKSSNNNKIDPSEIIKNENINLKEIESKINIEGLSEENISYEKTCSCNCYIGINSFFSLMFLIFFIIFKIEHDPLWRWFIFGLFLLFYYISILLQLYQLEFYDISNSLLKIIDFNKFKVIFEECVNRDILLYDINSTEHKFAYDFSGTLLLTNENENLVEISRIIDIYNKRKNDFNRNNMNYLNKLENYYLITNNGKYSKFNFWSLICLFTLTGSCYNSSKLSKTHYYTFKKCIIYEKENILKFKDLFIKLQPKILYKGNIYSFKSEKQIQEKITKKIEQTENNIELKIKSDKEFEEKLNKIRLEEESRKWEYVYKMHNFMGGVWVEKDKNDKFRIRVSLRTKGEDTYYLDKDESQLEDKLITTEKGDVVQYIRIIKYLKPPIYYTENIFNENYIKIYIPGIVDDYDILSNYTNPI